MWLACVAWGCFPVQGRPVAASAGPVEAQNTELQKLPDLPPTPIDEFQRWLSLGPAERARILAQKPEDKRKTLQAKLEEYSALPVELREQRLNVLRLRWYLMPLMENPATNRAVQLSRIPATYRGLVESRLKEWDLLPPPLQKEVLEKETTRLYFVRLQSRKPAERERILNEVPIGERNMIEAGLAKWMAMSRDERSATYEQFDRFLQLRPEDKDRTLGVLSEEERQQMVQVLKTFQLLPPEQRQLCVDSFRKFANLTPTEREEFLNNAARWREMSAAERQTWRELVTALPPMPPGLNSAPPPPPLPLGGGQ